MGNTVKETNMKVDMSARKVTFRKPKKKYPSPRNPATFSEEDISDLSGDSDITSK